MDDMSSLYCQMDKINYRDEAFTHTVNAIAKWPRAYPLVCQRNRTVNLEGKPGQQLAGDEWVEMMSCSIYLLKRTDRCTKDKKLLI